VSPAGQQNVPEFMGYHESERVSASDRMMIHGRADAVPEHVHTPSVAVRLCERPAFDVFLFDESVSPFTSKQHHVDCELECTSVMIGLRRRFDTDTGEIIDVR
jgi:hypothetical protein